MNITALKTRAAELAAITAADLTDEQAEELRSTVVEIEKYNERAASAARAVELVAQSEPVTRSTEDAPATLGASFVRSKAFTGYAGRGTSEAFDADINVRAFVGLTDLSIVPERTTIATAVVPLPLTGVIGSQTVSGNAVEWVVESFDSNAAATAEGDAAPESFYETSVVPVSLEKIAHYTQMSEEAAADQAAIQSTIDGKLRRGLAVDVESKIAAAIVGGTYATATEDSLIAAIRKAQALVEGTGFRPNTVLLNPADLADLDISFITVNQGTIRGTNFWGLNAVASSAVPVGQAYVGDFTSGVTMFARAGAQVTLTDSHEGNFIKGIVTALASLRGKAVVTQASAIAKAAVTA